MIILTTQRLLLRKLTTDDFSHIARTLQDPQAMYAYGHAFSDSEIQAWLDKQLLRYQEDGFGLWAIIRRSDGAFIGQCGLTYQDCPLGRVLEVGYLLERAYWHNGYAQEAAIACKNYACSHGHTAVFSIIRDNNYPSMRVVEANGMEVVGSFVKQYNNTAMPHFIYKVDRKTEA